MLFKELMGNTTQNELADKLISRWASGKGVPKTKDLPRIAKALNVSVEQVLECFTSETKKAE